MMRLTITLILRPLVVHNLMEPIGKLDSNCSTLIGPMIKIKAIQETHQEIITTQTFTFEISTS